MGMLGQNGRGLAEETGCEADVDFIVGTFSKSLAATGGYCASRRPELDSIRFAIRSYIFTASPSPSVVASTRAALRILRERPQLRKQLWDNAHRLYNGLRDLGFQTGPQASPVVAVTIDDHSKAIACWDALMRRGVYVNLVMPPATPTDSCLLRCSVSAAHTTQQIDQILDAYAELRRLDPDQAE